jgi:hypothetical protein
MKTCITGKWEGPEISEKEFILERLAQKDYSDFVYGKENFELYNRAFNKPSGSYFARLLVINGAFTLQFDESEKDEAVNRDIFYLLKCKRKLNLPKWFVNRLKNIERNSDFWARACIKRRHIDWAIRDWIDSEGLKEFTKSALHYLDSLEWGRDPILSADERRRAEGAADFDVVAAVSYLIVRAAHVDENKSVGVSGKAHIGMQELVIEATMYLYHKQKMHEACYFGGQYSLGLLSSDVSFYGSAKSAISGVYLDNMYQQEDMANKRTSRQGETLSACSEKELERHMLLVEAKAYGIPSDRLKTFSVLGNLTFFDVLLLSGALNMFVASPFSEKHPGMCGEISRSDLIESIDYGLFDSEKAKIACGLVVTTPRKLMDLYLTPFVEIDGTLFFSTALVINDNFCRNIATNSYKKQKELSNQGSLNSKLKENEKGTLFEKQVQAALLTKLTKVYQGIDYSISIGGIEEKSDIDVLAIEGNAIHVIECKSELTPMDYFDYRRDAQIIDHANYQLKRAMIFLKSPEGEKRLRELFGESADECTLSPCLMISNARSSCEEFTEFPIYSFYELEMALDDGALTVLGKRYEAIHKKEGIFLNLEEKKLANIILKSTGSYVVISSLLFFWQFRFQEFLLNQGKFEKAMSKAFSGYQYHKILWKNKHPKLFAFLLILGVLALLPVLSWLIRYLVGLLSTF